MKILHFILGKANPERANGVNKVIHGLAKYSSIDGHEVHVVGVSKGMDKKRTLVQREEFKVEVFNKFIGSCYDRLKDLSKDVDIVHLHSVWQHYNLIFGNYLNKIGKPYVITIHAGLSEDRIRQSKYLLKLLYHNLFQKKVFENASGIHAITREETTSIKKYINNKEIFYVPNGIDLDNYELNVKEYENSSNKDIKFGYLGRFGKEKNVEGLIHAVSQLPQNTLNKCSCYLIGPIDKEAEKLQNLVNELGLSDKVVFTGGIYGTEKYQFLKSLDFYVHPAFSDVVSIAVMEAMACGLPSVITRTSDVAYYNTSNAFIMVEPNSKEIKRGINKMINSRNEWEEMSKNATNLVSEYFNWESSAKKMLDEYKRLLTKMN